MAATITIQKITTKYKNDIKKIKNVCTSIREGDKISVLISL